VTLQLTAEQQAVYDAIEQTTEHLFVTGRAGTGKSTLLNHLSFHSGSASSAPSRSSRTAT